MLVTSHYETLLIYGYKNIPCNCFQTLATSLQASYAFPPWPPVERHNRGCRFSPSNRKLERYFLNTSVQAPYAELDSSCPSLLSWHLIKGSTIAAIVLITMGLLLVVLPAVALLFSCAKNNFVVHTVPYSPFGEHGSPLPADYCPSRNQSYGGQRTGGIDNSPSNYPVRWLGSVNASPAIADERSIVSRNSQAPLTSDGQAGQRNTRDYGGGGDEVLSDEDFQDCSASGIDQPAHSHLAACRLILMSEPDDHHYE